MRDKHVLDGKFLHLLGQDGKIDRQGMVIEVVGEYATVQWFNFLDGAPSTVTPVKVDELMVPEYEPYSRVRLYASHREWLLASAKQNTQNWARGPWVDDVAWSDWYDDKFSEVGE